MKTSLPQNREKWGWLLYALPMIVVWGLFLLIFFPGFMTDDAFYELRQTISGQYNDWHPILYTLMIGFISKIYFSPASMVFMQILMVSIAVAWGLFELEHMGVSKKILWVLAFLYALIPFNIILPLTVWKDIPYSAAIFILSVIFLKIVNTRGEWLKGRWNWFGLGCLLGVISLLRKNGLPVAIGAIIILLILFRKEWRRLIFVFVIFLVMLAVMYGPIYSFLKVKRVPEFEAVLFLHHIAAHISAGTTLTTDQRDYLNKLAPLDSWRYNCCSVIATQIPIFPDFSFQRLDLPLLKQDILKPISISIDLFLKNPAVDVRDMACASEIVWKIGSKCGGKITEGLSPASNFKNPVDSYRISGNEFGFIPKSLFPSLIGFANHYLQINPSSFFHSILYTPVIYLYMAIVCTIILIIRRKRVDYLLFLIPVALQSLTLIMVNYSPAIRFQYGVFLVGLLSIGFLFIPIKQKGTDLMEPLEKAVGSEN